MDNGYRFDEGGFAGATASDLQSSVVNSSRTYIFEEPTLALRLRTLFPEYAGALHSIWELLDSSPSPDREAVLAFLPEPLHEDIESILNAIRLFRGAMVLSSEDIDYALENLAPTPRVRGLRGILHAYLEGPGQTDGFARLGEWLEQLKSGEPFPIEGGELCFVPALEPTLFFRELALTAASTRKAQIRELWDLPWAEGGNRRGVIYRGSWTQTLKSLARTGIDEEKVHFSVQGEPGRASFLHRYLDHLGFPEREIEPFSLLSPPPGHAWLAFCDQSALLPLPGENWLRAGELEQLHQAGFPLARPAERRHRLGVALRSLERPSLTRRRLFTTLEESDLPTEVRTVSLRPVKKVSVETRDESRVALPPRSLSATQLETFARCPSQYLFSSRLRLQRKDLPDRTYPLIFGKAVHRALENFLKEGKQDLNAYFEAAVKEMAPGTTDQDPLWWMLTENFTQVARRFTSVEARLREMLGPLTPAGFEKEFELEIDGLRIKGVIDRLDNQGPGVLLLDYKTGNVDFTPNHMANGEHFQALLYLLAAEKIFQKPCLGLIFYDLKKGEVKRGVLFSDRVPPEYRDAAKNFMTRGHILTRAKYEELRDQGLEHLRRVASSIREGNFAATPSADACGFCDFAAHCGKGVDHV